MHDNRAATIINSEIAFDIRRTELSSTFENTCVVNPAFTLLK